MRIIKIVALVLIAGGVVLAARQFVRKISSTAPSRVQSEQKVKILSAITRYEYGSYHFGDIALLDNGEAWSVGYDGKHPRRVYHSKDVGKSWDAMDVVGNDFIMKALSFPDSQHGWAVGNNGLIIRTTDGGKSWEMLEPPTSSNLEVVHFVNSQVGYIGGKTAFLNKITDEVTGSFEILCTKDGGNTWRRCYKENQPISFFQITSFSESAALAIMGGSQLIRTDDQGETWRNVPLSARYIHSIAFAPNGVGWMVGPKGVFQYSDDGGKSWQQSTSLPKGIPNMDWEAVSFNSKGDGLVVGKDGTLALTSNSGKTWELLSLTISDELRAIRMQGSLVMILGAKNIYSVSLSG